ncbi:MAG TPA: tetraacyldisaccharide 4'-kinase [Thermoanaerobaculia bacterium]|nr:tetraacyldisaccharide 4'-kinase [Thermoanaerobaculia bacterium]
MRVLQALWMAVNRARRALYRAGILRGKKLHRPVISVGGITAGGAGKTPAVIAVARALADRHLRVAVLTRGYGRNDQSYSGPVTTSDADKFGDEPVLIRRSIIGEVLVGANRYLNGRNFDCDVFVLDDGFQHLQLRRDYDLVIDAPARIHREGRSALRDADAVIPRQLRTLVPEELRGRRVFAFSGLADNEQFFASLREAGLDVAGTRSFPDHHRYTPADVEALKRDAKGLPLVTSEKDKVKIADAAVLSVGAELVIPEDVLEEIINVGRGVSPPPAGEGGLKPRPASRKRRKHPLLQRIEYVAYRFVARRVTAMSEEAVHRWGTRLGALGGKVLKGRDRLMMRNLRLVYPDRPEGELRKLANECWRHFGREALISIQTQNLSLEQIAERCRFENAHILEEAIARGKGTILISAHWGGWEVAGLAIMSLIRNVRTVARPLDNELLERELQQIRARTGAEVVDRRKAARVLLKGLAENGLLILLVDQAVLPREGVLVPFLGHPGWTTPAPAKMALRAGSTIVFAFCIPDGLRHRLEFQESIRADLLTEAERDPVELTKRINEIISRRIHARPDLWLWMHDRWKGTGEGGVEHGV